MTAVLLKAQKVVSALPGTLEADTLYFVRTGVGFDLYVSDQTGAIAHKSNAPKLENLENVLITSVTDNELIVRDQATEKWINKTLSEAGISQVGHTHSAYSRASNSQVGASVFADIAVSNGIVTGITTRSLTPSDIGAVAEVQGTFTPVAVGSTAAGTGTYGARSGNYLQQGDGYQFELSIAWTAHTGTGNLKIGGLPFAASDLSILRCMHSGLTVTTGNVVVPITSAGSTQITLYMQSTAGALAFLPMDTAVTELYISGFVRT